MFSLARKSKVNIHSLTITDLGWPKVRDEKNIIQWVNPENTIAVSVNFFDIQPDIPTIKNIDTLRRMHRNSISSKNGGLIEVSLSAVNHLPLIKTLFKIPQEEAGTTYLASLTLPFKNCSYVLKVQAAETGDTGIREASIVNKLLSENAAEEVLSGWSADPYDNSFKDGIPMNRSEQQIYDTLFPDHPLTRARQLIAQIEKDIKLKPEIDKLALFEK